MLEELNLEGIIKRTLKGFFVGAALLLSTGCGALHHSYNEMIRKQEVVAPHDFGARKLTKANKLLLKFPTAEQINACYSADVVKSVDKYLAPGATKVVAHLKQIHYVEGMSEEDKKEVRACQENIESIILVLPRKVIYNEGISSKYWAKESISVIKFVEKLFNMYVKDLKKEVRGLKGELRHGDAKDYLRKTIEEKRETIKRLEKRKRDPLYGAVNKLAAERKIKMLPAERKNSKIKELSKKVKKGEKKLTDSEVIDAVVDGREDIFLEIASKQRHPLVIVVYGGAHAWGGKESCGPNYLEKGRLSLRDNIAEWNKKYPNEAFSLIEITPKDYGEELDTHPNKSILF